MSTPCYLIVELENQKYKFKMVSVHWNGYDSYMIPILNKNYSSFKQAKDLLSHGSLSIVKESGFISYSRDTGQCFEDNEPEFLNDVELDEFVKTCGENIYKYSNGKWLQINENA